MRVLLVGAYGFIGSGVARALIAAGYEVVGFGRSVRTGQRLFPDIRWRVGDLNRLTNAADWHDALHDIDAVVNASGALQDGGGERLEHIQGESICALIAACEAGSVAHFVQISAPGTRRDDPNPFMATKAIADERLRRSGLKWAILRPGLVISHNAYGGTMLIRALAAMPSILFTVHGGRRIQTVSLKDVAEAVLCCLSPDAPPRIDVDLVERDARPLATLIADHRRWLGIGKAWRQVDLPAWVAAPISAMADLLGHLGWRSPLRGTAMAMIARDVTGDAEGGERLLGRPLLRLEQTLARHPAGNQDRWQARLALMLPAMVGALALPFILSGIVSLTQLDRVTAELDGTAVAGGLARLLGFVGGIADLLLGVAILIRRWARSAALGMAGLTLSYLVMGSWLRPDMWSDPLAPLAKAVAAMMLALVTHTLLEER